MKRKIFFLNLILIIAINYNASAHGIFGSKGSIRGGSYAQRCNISQVATILLEYIKSNGGIIPEAEDSKELELILRKYLEEKGKKEAANNLVMFCPLEKTISGFSHYHGWNKSLSEKHINELKNKENIPLIWCLGTRHIWLLKAWRIVAFADGGIKECNKEEWLKIAKDAGISEDIEVENEVRTVKLLLNSYFMENLKYPKSIKEATDKIIGKKWGGDLYLFDPWGNNYRFALISEEHLLIASKGKNRRWDVKNGFLGYCKEGDTVIRQGDDVVYLYPALKIKEELSQDELEDYFIKLKSSNPWVRREAAEILGQAKIVKAGPSLLQTLQNERSYVPQIYEIWALGRIKYKEALPLLTVIAFDEWGIATGYAGPSLEARKALEKILPEQVKADIDIKRMTEILDQIGYDLISTYEERVGPGSFGQDRKDAIRRLAEIGGKKAVKIIKSQLKDDSTRQLKRFTENITYVWTEYDIQKIAQQSLKEMGIKVKDVEIYKDFRITLKDEKGKEVEIKAGNIEELFQKVLSLDNRIAKLSIVLEMAECFESAKAKKKLMEIYDEESWKAYEKARDEIEKTQEKSK